MFLSVIIPAYNESQRIGRTLRAVHAYLKEERYEYEIIVVDDGSSDATASLVHANTRRIKALRLLRLPRNEGKGWAVREGMLAATGRYRLFMDADGATAIEHWPALKERLESGADVAVGSRHVAGATIVVRQAMHREMLGHLFRLVVRALFRLPVIDTQNGFKAFTAAAAEKIFSRQRLKGWAFDVEVLTVARDLHFSIAEVPVAWFNDDRSRLRVTSTPLMLLDILKVRLALARTASSKPLSRTPELARRLR